VAVVTVVVPELDKQAHKILAVVAVVAILLRQDILAALVL
jgi:hypothetical protein